MGIVVTESLVCDFCASDVKPDEAFRGQIALRKQGARGLGRNFELILHEGCMADLTKTAQPGKAKASRRSE